jgi:Ca2+-dependent lipid-binding protein
MTVTLIEGENFTVTEANTFTNPFVVFTCNGKRRTSSVKLRTPNPNWCEIFEFDAMEDPPSTMDVEVFDYDGPFSEAESLGHAEVNFLKQSSGDLSDFWVSLSGRHARTHAPRLHLRVFLTNTKESDSLPKYLERVEKEVGTKVQFFLAHYISCCL